MLTREKTERPRILYLSPFWPGKATSASELRGVQVGRALQDVGDVEVVVLDSEDQVQQQSVRDDCQVDVAYSVSLRACSPKGPIEKASWALNPRVKNPHGLTVDRQDLQRVLLTAERFDLIWFFKLRSANAFPCWSWPRSVVDVDDVPSTFEHSLLRTERGVQARLSTLLRLWSWRRREGLLDDRFSVLAVCSEVDKQYLRRLGLRNPIHVIPNGYERPLVTPVRRAAEPPRLGFIGIFDHEPNLAGVQWFARDCWPLIKKEVPDARLRLVGRLSDGPLAPRGRDIDGLGWVADPTDEIATWSAMVVPVREGAGTRGKIAHAFSLKCPVVSTSLGALGYEPKDGHNMFLGESSEDFARACVRTIRQPTAAAEVAERAWQTFLETLTWDAIRSRVWAAAEDCLRSR